MNDYDYDDKYADYEAAFFPEKRVRQCKKKINHQLKKSYELPADVAEMQENEDAGIYFNPSYMQDKPDNAERSWLIKHLTPFYLEEFITDITSNIKGGKEASVYCCKAHTTLQTDFVAAKIYRPAILRSLKNDAVYREGRFGDRTKGEVAEVLIGGRTARAMKKGTRFGKQRRIGSWIAHEFKIMNKLYNAGTHLPTPIAHKSHVILMALIGTIHQPAPPLHYVTLDPDEAQTLFWQLLDDVETMLRLECIHGDLSAYNILYWDGEVKIIDFPQTVNPFFNPNSYFMLERDVTRICEHFSKYKVVMRDGQSPEASKISATLWEKHQNQTW